MNFKKLINMNENFKKRRTEIISKMIDNPNEMGIYPTTICFEELDSLFEELQPKWNNTIPSEGAYLCFMDNCYMKMCYYNGSEWLDMWQNTLNGIVKYWMNLPKQPNL